MNKETFTTLALYNREVNRVVQTIVEANEALCTEPGTTWFGSVTDMLTHVAAGDIGWIRRLWYGDAPAPRELSRRVSSLVEQKNPSIAEWTSIRHEVDAVMDSYCDGLTPEILVEPLRLKRSTGEAYELPRWQCLLGMFNHETHHRGQLAQLLDSRAVENDYSNLYRYLLDD
ncbi:MAG: DinB family protein [Spirochaetaceae bacterium]